MKLIICIRKKLNLHGHSVRSFRYDAVRDVHIWQGRELGVEEFNRESQAVITNNSDLAPFALVVEEAQEVAATSAAQDTVSQLEGSLKKWKGYNKAGALAENLATLVSEHAAMDSILTPVVPAPARKKKKRGGSSK